MYKLAYNVPAYQDKTSGLVKRIDPKYKLHETHTSGLGSSTARHNVPVSIRVCRITVRADWNRSQPNARRSHQS